MHFKEREREKERDHPDPLRPKYVNSNVHGENFMAIFTTLSVVIWFSTGTLGIFATLVYVFTMRVVIYDILSMAINTTLPTAILFCNLYYIYCEFHHAVW